MGRTTHDSTTRDARAGCCVNQACEHAHIGMPLASWLADCVAPCHWHCSSSQHRTPQAVAWVQ